MTASFARALESFQASVLMAHIGAMAEARALIRLSVEATIAIGALKHDPQGFADKLLEDHHRHRRRS
jgi:uncharacterized protein DUF5677